MNLILFEEGELERTLSPGDRRARHILTVLRRKPGEEFDVGVVGGPQGKAWIRVIAKGGLELDHRLDALPETKPAKSGPEITLFVGLSRPQTMRRILRDTTSLGVDRILVAPTELGEASYASSSLWTDGEFRRHLLEGAEQARSTRLPEVLLARAFHTALADLPVAGDRVALDTAATTSSLATWRPSGAGRESVCLAVGSERGWTDNERTALSSYRFSFAGIGPRSLRAESACLIGLALVFAGVGRFG